MLEQDRRAEALISSARGQEISLVSEVYTDGGCIGRNPSADGGTWAWIHVYLNGSHKLESGSVHPTDVGMKRISNNLTELLAMILAFEALPFAWSGAVFTDSLCTLVRADKPTKTKFKNIPHEYRKRLIAARGRLGELRFTLLAGHPSRAHIAAGEKKGKPVSVWNKICDTACQEAAAEYRRHHATAGASK